MQAAAWAQTILYSIFIRAGDPKPQPGSVRFVKHRRQILIAIYAAYFAFTIYEVDFNLQRSSNAYNDLGVPINVDETSLNSRFRKLTIRFHPDKIAAGIDREAANAYYIHLKHARDVILDPAKRFAYDRFGPDIFAQCQSCVTVKDYVDSALLSALTSYGVLLVFLIGANALGFSPLKVPEPVGCIPQLASRLSAVPGHRNCEEGFHISRSVSGSAHASIPPRSRAS
jgi:hypothetical protein